MSDILCTCWQLGFVLENITMQKNIELAFISDDKYVLPLVVAITSLKLHLHPEYQYHLHIICVDMSAENELLLQVQSWQNLSIRLIKVQHDWEHGFDRKELHASSAALQKFNLPLTLKELDKVLYLDCDIIIQNDLVAFYEIDITDYYGAAVPDGPRTRNLHGNRKHAYSLKPDYFNSGVMLLNLKLLREQGMPQKLLAYKQQEYNYFMDQDAFNVVLEGKMLMLPLYYNVQLNLFAPNWEVNSLEELARFYKMEEVDSYERYFDSGFIIHYTTEKPWRYYDSLLAEKWAFYYKYSSLGKTPLCRKSMFADNRSYKLGAALLYLPKRLKRLLEEL